MNSSDGGGGGDRRSMLLVVICVVLSVAWVFVLLRAYVRVYVIKKISSDDWWMFASMITYTGYSINAFIGLRKGGTGKHVSQLTQEETYIGLKTWYVAEIMYAPLSAMVRTSVAIFLLRVATEPIHRWIVIVDIAVVWIVGVAFLFMVSFQCDPPTYFYEQVFGAVGKCMNLNVVPDATIAHSVINAVCDLVFAALPIAMLWNVQLNKRTKIVIAVLLGMGAIAGVALLVRIPYVKVLGITPDFLYETIDVAIWTVLEPSLGIIAGCLATLRPLFKGLGFGRKSTINYNSVDSRALGYGNSPGGGGGDSSHRSWFSRKTAYMQKLGDGPPGTLDNAALVESASAVRRQGKWALSSSKHAEAARSDIELQLTPQANPVEAIQLPPRAIISTNIGADPWTECEAGRGISVRTSFHTESEPRGLDAV